MPEENLILVQTFCSSHDIDSSFVNELLEAGLIEVIIVENDNYLKADQLRRLEKMVRLRYELDINLEGIEAITHLLERIEEMQSRITELHNRLKLYE